MLVKQIAVGPLRENVYFYVDDISQKVVIIDPGAEADKIIQYIKKYGWEPVSILLTHGHYDHIGAIAGIQNQYPIDLVVLDKEADLLGDSHKNLSRSYFGDNQEYQADLLLSDGMLYDPFSGYGQLQVLHTPGHTQGSACYYSPEHAILFSGDTLFHQSVGRTDHYSGDMAIEIQSIQQKLSILPDNTAVYPGHGIYTTIGFEKAHNPYLK